MVIRPCCKDKQFYAAHLKQPPLRANGAMVSLSHLSLSALCLSYGFNISVSALTLICSLLFFRAAF